MGAAMLSHHSSMRTLYIDHHSWLNAWLRSKLGKDIMLVLIDNSYVDGSSTVIARTDLEGNTHQFRTTDAGERYEVLKNFPSDSHLRKKFAHSAREIRMKRLEYYWLLSCRLK